VPDFSDPAADAFVDLRGLRFHYREYRAATGGPDAAPPIVLLHGLASTSRIWMLTAPFLAERCRVVALDQRGHGETAKPDAGYDFASVTADAVAFLDALGLERAVLAGHSWGGNVAVEVAARHPKRVAGLVLVDGGFFEVSSRPGMTWQRAEQELAPPDLSHLTAEELVAMAKKWELGPIWSPEVEAALLANFEVTEGGTIRPRFARAHHMQVVRALWEQKVSQLFPSVRCPVLFVCAERERSEGTREMTQRKRDGVERAQALLSDCRVVWFEDTIHDIPLHRPERLARTMMSFVDAL
jgi:pimeloyl-ACP methyl ester carboxylesterase